MKELNLFDKEGNLISTFIGKQEELKIKYSIDQIRKERKSPEEITKLVTARLPIVAESKVAF